MSLELRHVTIHDAFTRKAQWSRVDRRLPDRPHNRALIRLRRSFSQGSHHMKTFVALLVAGMLVAGPAFAQQESSPTQETKPAAPELTKSGKPKAHDVRANCRDEAKTQGLKGAERHKAVEDCFLKARPDLAAKEAVKEECKQDPKLKDLDKDARKAAIKECVKSKK
jgi:hypothetical protein